MTHASGFKSPEGEAAYRAMYGDVLKLWPVPYTELDIPGRFGTTHVIAGGPEDAPPLVLLHGFNNTSMIWLPNAGSFSEAYRVYAIDVMGQPSLSIPGEPVRETADYVTWLGETLDALDLDSVYLAGISYGAWISLNFAIARPDRVRKLVLLSPAAVFQPLAWQFGVRAMLSGIIRTRAMMNSLFGWMGLKAAPGDTTTARLLDLIAAGGEYFQMPPEMRGVMPGEFSDDELRSLQVPALLLIGEDEVIYDAQKAMNRARRLVPDLQGDLVPDASHAMSYNQHEIVNARVLEFLNHR